MSLFMNLKQKLMVETLEKVKYFIGKSWSILIILSQKAVCARNESDLRETLVHVDVNIQSIE